VLDDVSARILNKTEPGLPSEGVENRRSLSS
jgi:hypothetical protein